MLVLVDPPGLIRSKQRHRCWLCMRSRASHGNDTWSHDNYAMRFIFDEVFLGLRLCDTQCWGCWLDTFVSIQIWKSSKCYTLLLNLSMTGCRPWRWCCVGTGRVNRCLICLDIKQCQGRSMICSYVNSCSPLITALSF